MRVKIIKGNSTIKITVKGLVQGVGFRPFIYRLATNHQITGWVKNADEGVIIHASGDSVSLALFVDAIKTDAPAAASILSITTKKLPNGCFTDFRILKSDNNRNAAELTQIGPDIAVCANCLTDLKKQTHRVSYPLINCTHCGPRFSIIKNLPYDRVRTTMGKFAMCRTCHDEFNDINDRRFHAQPIACNQCGPIYKMLAEGEEITNFEAILKKSASMLDGGRIVAVKGVGGFFIACDALKNPTILKLRNLKGRDGKPFAVMFRNTNKVLDFCFADSEELTLLQSWRRPVVILPGKGKLPDGVSNGLKTVGAFLPYMPFHYLLFEKLKTDALVFTSGNFSDEPIIKSNKKAFDKLATICDAVVFYNRKIYNRVDDSVDRIINSKPQIIRRSRGYAPAPVPTTINVTNILAVGGELKNTFCIGRNNSAILSQHIGDLKDHETFQFYSESINRFKKLFRVNPELVAHDLHPDYYSTKFAKESGLPAIAVQHHHAHVVSCMAEHSLDEDVIGVCFDGTGMGDDGHIWGSEFFICNAGKYQRLAHFEYMPMPGGDLAVAQPWRMAVALLYQILGKELVSLNLPLVRSVGMKKIEWLTRAMDKNINCPLTSGAGRIFDAVSALLGLCLESTFEAEAPMRLEDIAGKNEDDLYPYRINRNISFSETIKGIIFDLKTGIKPAAISGKFHNTIAAATCDKIVQINKQSGLKKVVLSGGVFQNKILLEKIVDKISAEGYEVYTHSQVPANDGGISLGQLIIAAKKRSKQCV